MDAKRIKIRQAVTKRVMFFIICSLLFIDIVCVLELDVESLFSISIYDGDVTEVFQNCNSL
jgi:hypothetical protein